MSATTAGALKAFLETQSLGVSIHRDRPPASTAEPFITISEAISVTPEPAFNQHDDPDGHVSELAQVDIWQKWRTDTNTIGENYTLVDAVCLALRGVRLSTAPTHVSGISVLNRVRLVEQDTNIVHDAITVRVRRVLRRSA